MSISEEVACLCSLIYEYVALPEMLLTTYERACAHELLAGHELTVSHTIIGPVYTLDPSAACLPGHWSVKGPGSMLDAASLAALRLLLETQGGRIDRYQMKGRPQLAAPRERGGVPTAMTMHVPGTLFGLCAAPVPCLAVATISNNGVTRRRAKELLKTHPLLLAGDYHLVIGTLDPDRFGRLGQYRGPDGQRVHVQLLPLLEDHAL